MAKPNYRFDKRQRELQKSRKKEEKRQKKLTRAESPDTPASEREPTT